MRKLLSFVSFVLLLLLTVTTQAAVNKDTNVAVDDGYSCYVVHDMRFVIPDYFEVSATTASDEGVYGQVLNDSGDASVILLLYWEDYDKKEKAEFTIAPEAYMQGYTEGFVKAAAKDIDATVEYGVVESLSSHGKDCYLVTSSASGSNESLIIKTLLIDDDATGLYIGAYIYQTDLENTKYSNDFYKLLYTDPTANNQTSSSKEDFINAWGSYYKGLDDLQNGNYDGFVHSMADAMDYAGAFDDTATQESSNDEYDDDYDLDEYVRMLEALGNIASAIN